MTFKQTMMVMMLIIIFPLLYLWMIGENASWAHEDIYTLAHGDIFGELRRAPVVFLHGVHEDALDAEGCDICHHVPDKQTGKLIYVEDEELPCKECHGAKRKATSSALREAYHGSCTLCHRALRKDENKKSGPTTCGECHKTSRLE